MIQVIFGKKGSGKTKRILDMANASVKEAKGNVLFIDDDKSYTLSLKPQIRFIDASEYAVKGKAPFYGFLAGILAGNYDISVIYVDAFLKLAQAEASWWISSRSLSVWWPTPSAIWSSASARTRRMCRRASASTRSDSRFSDAASCRLSGSGFFVFKE